MATSAVSSTTSANTAAMSTTTSGTSTTSAQAASKAAAQKLVTSLGSGSGVDVNSLAQNLVDAERIPRQTAIQKKIDKNNARVSGLSAMMYMLNDLKTKLAAMKDKSSLSSMTATSSSSAVSATAVAGAAVGSHEIKVNKLASAQRVVSVDGFASDSTPINNGQPFQISISKPGVTTGAAGVGASTATNGQVASLSGVTLNGGSDFSNFTVVVDGATLSLVPDMGAKTLKALGEDLTAKLRVLLDDQTITVTGPDSDSGDLTIDGGVGRTVESPSLSPSGYSSHLDGLSFGSPPASTDFESFSVDMVGGGTSLTVISPLTAEPPTPDGLAAAIQGQLNGEYSDRFWVRAVGTAEQFRLYFSDTAGGNFLNPALTLSDGTTAGTLSTGASVVGSERVATVTNVGVGALGDFESFSIKIDGGDFTVYPDAGATTIAGLASDLQAKLRAATEISDLTVGASGGQLSFSSASVHTYSQAKLQPVQGAAILGGARFGSSPATDDFRGFSVVVAGTRRTVTPSPATATPADLAADLQDKIQATDPDVTVRAISNSDGSFSLYLSSSDGRTIASPTLQTNQVDMTPPQGLSGGTAFEPAAGVRTGVSAGQTISGISLGASPDSGNLRSFTVSIDGVARTVTPAQGLTTLGDLALDLQDKLNAIDGGSDLVVSGSGGSLTVSSASGRAIARPMFSASALGGASFATNAPTTKDFRGFGLTVDGANFAIVPAPAAATLEALAADLQTQLRSQDGKSDLSVTVDNGSLRFWSASGRSITNPVLLPNTYELTPAGVARAINDKKLGLTAQVVNTGSAANPYKLVVSSATGARQAFSIGSNATLGNTIRFDTLSPAGDAEIVVDGVPMTRSTNTVSDAIAGVTLSLRGTTPGGTTPTPASLDIGLDTTSFKTKMTDMVSSFNDTWDLLNQVSDPKSTLETYGATLVGDSVVRSVKQQVRAMFQGTSTTPGAAVSSLWQLGIKIDERGVMTFDGAAFDTTVQSSYSDVVKSLTGNFDNLSTYSTAPAGFAGDAVRKLTRLLDTAGNGGPILSASENASTQNTRYQEDLTKLQTRMDALLVRYQKQLAAMDSLVGSTNARKTSLKSTFDGMMSVYNNN